MRRKYNEPSDDEIKQAIEKDHKRRKSPRRRSRRGARKRRRWRPHRSSVTEASQILLKKQPGKPQALWSEMFYRLNPWAGQIMVPFSYGLRPAAVKYAVATGNQSRRVMMKCEYCLFEINHHHYPITSWVGDGEGVYRIYYIGDTGGGYFYILRFGHEVFRIFGEQDEFEDRVRDSEERELVRFVSERSPPFDTTGRVINSFDFLVCPACSRMLLVIEMSEDNLIRKGIWVSPRWISNNLYRQISRLLKSGKFDVIADKIFRGEDLTEDEIALCQIDLEKISEP